MNNFKVDTNELKLDIDAYNLYCDFRESYDLGATTFVYFMTNKNLEKYHKFYIKANNILRKEKLTKLNKLLD